MKLVIALFFVTLITLARSANVCCTPSQWEGEAAGVYLDRTQNDTDAFFEFISYDIANDRMRVDFYERVYHDHEIRKVEKTFIEKFEAGEFRLYTIDKSDSNNVQCTWERKNTPLKPLCVQDDYSHSYDFTIGAELEATLFRYEHDDYRDDIIVTRKTCIPISGFQFEHHGRERQFDFKVDYWNIVPGIKNPNIFDTPTNCRRQ